MREIVFDTETTGVRADLGHRVVELGAVEIIDGVIGESVQFYFNPERKVDAGAYEVHGLSDEFLADQPTFVQRLPEILEFFAHAPLVAHNADFDRMFLNAELKICDYPAFPASRFIDTLKISRQLYKSGRHTLDALCERHHIDTRGRTLHGALKDSQLLAEVYLLMTAGQQHAMPLEVAERAMQTSRQNDQQVGERADFSKRNVMPVQTAPEILEAHQQFVARDLNKALWLDRPDHEVETQA